MKRARLGFTLIEVSLFLAVTTALFVGIAAATQNSIFQQRYNDSVQNFAEFLRSAYSQVSNVQNENTGRSGQAIYGKVITFDVDESTGANQVKSYNLIGDTEQAAGTCRNNTSTLTLLACYNANIITSTGEGDNVQYLPVGFVEDYIMRWSSGLQSTDTWNDYGIVDGSVTHHYRPFEGFLVIARSPTTGGIYTYVMQKGSLSSTDNRDNKIDDILAAITNCENSTSCPVDKDGRPNPFVYDIAIPEDPSVTEQHLFNAIIDGQPTFNSTDDIDFCVNPNGLGQSNLRRNVRIIAGSHTATGVQIITDDEVIVQNPTTGEDINEGNRCQ